MKNINLKTSITSTRSVNKLIDKINATCDALLDTLTLTPSSVGNFGISMSEKLDSEFVDRVVKSIWLLKNHLRELRESINS